MKQSEAHMGAHALIDCGWGRLLFGDTFENPQSLAVEMREEAPEGRDVAIYVTDPHVALALAPHELFLDPSHTYRLDLSSYEPATHGPTGFVIRPLDPRADRDAFNRIYAARNMAPIRPNFLEGDYEKDGIRIFVAEEDSTAQVLGSVMAIDHFTACGAEDRGSSFWCLVVDPQARWPGLGEALVRAAVEYLRSRGAAFTDLTVLYNNEQAIALYDKLGFARVPYFTLKRKNSINERLFTGPAPEAALNPYAGIIVDEARRRGIDVRVTDAEGGFFRLSLGGRSIHCRESLSELTTGVATSICDDKAVTRRIVEAAGVIVPEQIVAGDEAEMADFLSEHGKLVAKPARGEQGRGIAVGLETLDEVKSAVATARQYCDRVLLERCFSGETCAS